MVITLGSCQKNPAVGVAFQCVVVITTTPVSGRPGRGPNVGVSMMQPKKEQAGLAEIVLEPLGMNAVSEIELCVGVVGC